MMSNDALRDCSNTASQSSMENSQQRKRPASPLNNNEAKRSRSNANTDDDNSDDASESIAAAQSVNLSKNTTFVESSVERLLSVPLEIIFRQVPGAAPNKRKHLLTRAEAQCMVKTSQLAHEVDAIVDISSEALSRQVWCHSFSRSIQQVPFLRSVLPVLSVHGNDITSRALYHVQGELDRVSQELDICASALRQYSEQNWTLSESLLDAFGDAPSSGQDLAREKRIMAEIEEEVSSRIDRLLSMSSTQEVSVEKGHVNDAFEQATDETSGEFVSMQQFCTRLFGYDNDIVTPGERAAVQQEDVATEKKGMNGNIPSSVNATKDKGSDDKHGEKNLAPQESTTNVEAPNPLLALANEAEEREHHSQWSGSTVTIKTPERSSSVNEDDDDDDEEEQDGLMGMTQGTGNAVAALTVLASGGRRDSQRVDDGND